MLGISKPTNLYPNFRVGTSRYLFSKYPSSYLANIPNERSTIQQRSFLEQETLTLIQINTHFLLKTREWLCLLTFSNG